MKMDEEKIRERVPAFSVLPLVRKSQRATNEERPAALNRFVIGQLLF